MIPDNITLLVSGGASGADTLAEKYADENGIEKLIFKPDYQRFGKAAPLIRNRLIVESAELIIAIWNGVSKGTRFSIDYAVKLGKQIRLILIDASTTELSPGNLGKDCEGNGEHFDKDGKLIDCCCNECDYLLCCINENYHSMCLNCPARYCPRKF